jgi:hypothetical protein
VNEWLTDKINISSSLKTRNAVSRRFSSRLDNSLLSSFARSNSTVCYIACRSWSANMRIFSAFARPDSSTLSAQDSICIGDIFTLVKRSLPVDWNKKSPDSLQRVPLTFKRRRWHGNQLVNSVSKLNKFSLTQLTSHKKHLKHH